jgi:D-alanyl-D-alanine-carboxypeptidase/D-alanyl-D-alanine-endopeptidase
MRPTVLLLRALLLTMVMSSMIWSQSPRSTTLPSNASVRKLLAERVIAITGGDNVGVGIVVGIIGPNGRRVISYGQTGAKNQTRFDGDTVFEIGSVGKVFTALLLADMASRHEISLTDPVTKFLPSTVIIPERNGHPITLTDLATHTSGLPFMPGDVSSFNAAEEPASQFYKFLAQYQLKSDPGTEWDYSNLGYWLLGQALVARSGKHFESLMHERVMRPLGLVNTGFTQASRLKREPVMGHNAVLEPLPENFSIPMYASMSAAGLRVVSTVNDLLTFLSFAMDLKASPLASEMSLMLETQRTIGGDSKQALGWVVSGAGNDRLITHEGGTWGYNSYVGWDPQRRAGVVVLSNQPGDISDIGHYLLRPDSPLVQTTLMRRSEITLASDVLDQYVGNYVVEDEGTFEIKREHDFLVLKLPVAWGLPHLRLHPESRSDFFVKELPMRVIFDMDANGRVADFLLYPRRAQHPLRAQRETHSDSKKLLTPLSKSPPPIRLVDERTEHIKLRRQQNASDGHYQG